MDRPQTFFNILPLEMYSGLLPWEAPVMIAETRNLFFFFSFLFSEDVNSEDVVDDSNDHSSTGDDVFCMQA